MAARSCPARSYPEGVPCWVDTEQADVDEAIGFYAGLFGWTFEDVLPSGAPGRYVVATLGGRDVGAVAGPGQGDAAWNTYVCVDDADAAARRLTSAGGTVRSAPVDGGDGGRGAVLADPEGAEIRIWQPRRRLGAQVVNGAAAWNFSDLHTTSVTAAIAFYQEVFGWQFDDVGFATMIRRPGYGDHLEATVDPEIRARQSGTAPPGFEDAIGWLVPTRPDEPPHWHVTFAVADRDRTVAEAQRLGARILAHDDTEWTRTALVRDPQGAELTVSQFTPRSR